MVARPRGIPATALPTIAPGTRNGAVVKYKKTRQYKIRSPRLTLAKPKVGKHRRGGIPTYKYGSLSRALRESARRQYRIPMPSL